jgi:hypothetical protein
MGQHVREKKEEKSLFTFLQLLQGAVASTEKKKKVYSRCGKVEREGREGEEGGGRRAKTTSCGAFVRLGKSTQVEQHGDMLS